MEQGEQGTYDEGDTATRLDLRPGLSGVHQLRVQVDYLLDASGQPVGFQIELMKAVGRELGVEVSVSLQPWAATVEAFKAQRVDVIAFSPVVETGWDTVLLEAKRELVYTSLTINQLARRIAGARGHWQLVGTASDIVDQLEERFLAGGADGYNIMPPTLPGGLTDFIAHVVPELRRRGLFRAEYEGASLRQNLGLSKPGHLGTARHLVQSA